MKIQSNMKMTAKKRISDYIRTVKDENCGKKIWIFIFE